jgi:hypothetical protein
VPLAIVGVPIALVGGWLWLRHRAADEEQVRAEVGACAPCLPRELTLDTQFSDSPESDVQGHRRVTTVREKLIQLQARVADGRIYDYRNREIRFYPMHEWGTPPRDYREILKRERSELEDLERHYTVIRMYSTVVPI